MNGVATIDAAWPRISARARCALTEAASKGAGLRLARVFVFGTAAVAGLPATAQERGVTVTPVFAATQQFTDNRNLSRSDPQAESITVLSPGVRMSIRSAKVQGSVDYSLNAAFYARGSAANSVQNALASSLRAEVIEGHGFITAGATISRQSISALGLQGDRPNQINANSTEIRTLNIAPSLRGRLFGEVEIDARLSSSLVSSADSASGDSVAHNAGVRVGDNSRALGWSVDANRSLSNFDGGRETTQDTLRATLSYSPLSDLRVFVNAGTERNNVQSSDQRTSDTWGGGVNWQPTPRTQFGLTVERRFFGNSHSLNLSHRFKRSVLSYTDSRSSTQSTAGAGATLTVYDLYFAQFTSIEPDPVLRDLLVRNFLLAAGLNPNTRLPGGFVNSALTLQASRNLSFAIQGVRSSVVLSAFSTSTRRLDTLSGAQDDLSRVDVLNQAGWNLSWSHRLTPVSSLVFSASQQRTPSRGTVAGNGLKNVSVSWASPIARRVSLSVTGRHSQADGGNSYQENSLSASLSLSF